jgi:hypothetical protein
VKRRRGPGGPVRDDDDKRVVVAENGTCSYFLSSVDKTLMLLLFNFCHVTKITGFPIWPSRRSLTSIYGQAETSGHNSLEIVA